MILLISSQGASYYLWLCECSYKKFATFDTKQSFMTHISRMHEDIQIYSLSAVAEKDLNQFEKLLLWMCNTTRTLISNYLSLWPYTSGMQSLVMTFKILLITCHEARLSSINIQSECEYKLVNIQASPSKYSHLRLWKHERSFAKACVTICHSNGRCRPTMSPLAASIDNISNMGWEPITINKGWAKWAYLM